jgi:hypothetical protein
MTRTLNYCHHDFFSISFYATSSRNERNQSVIVMVLYKHGSACTWDVLTVLVTSFSTILPENSTFNLELEY